MDLDLPVGSTIYADGAYTCFELPGSMADIGGLSLFTTDLSANSVLYADKAYTLYEIEGLLHNLEGIGLIAKRKQIHKRKHSSKIAFGLAMNRSRMETVFSSITGRLPRHLRAKTLGNRARLAELTPSG